MLKEAYMMGPPENHRILQATAGDTTGRALNRRHRQKTWLAAATARKSVSYRCQLTA